MYQGVMLQESNNYWDCEVNFMLKKILLRAMLGFPLGIFLSAVIAIIISLAIGDGSYYACAPLLAETVGNELGAVILQTFLSGILGAAFAGASAVWESEKLSLIKQTGIYFLVSALAMLPIAYVSHWMDHSILGFLIYFGIFVGIFFIAWIIQYFIWRSRIKAMNDKVGS